MSRRKAPLLSLSWLANLVGYRKGDHVDPMPHLDVSRDAPKGPTSSSRQSADPSRTRVASERVATQAEESIVAESRRIGPMISEILGIVGRELAAGMTTEDVASRLVEESLARGLEPAMLGYNGFPAGAAISVNDELVHGCPRDDGSGPRISSRSSLAWYPGRRLLPNPGRFRSGNPLKRIDSSSTSARKRCAAPYRQSRKSHPDKESLRQSWMDEEDRWAARAGPARARLRARWAGRRRHPVSRSPRTPEQVTKGQSRQVNSARNTKGPSVTASPPVGTGSRGLVQVPSPLT